MKSETLSEFEERLREARVNSFTVCVICQQLGCDFKSPCPYCVEIDTLRREVLALRELMPHPATLDGERQQLVAERTFQLDLDDSYDRREPRLFDTEDFAGFQLADLVRFSVGCALLAAQTTCELHPTYREALMLANAELRASWDLDSEEGAKHVYNVQRVDRELGRLSHEDPAEESLRWAITHAFSTAVLFNDPYARPHELLETWARTSTLTMRALKAGASAPQIMAGYFAILVPCASAATVDAAIAAWLGDNRELAYSLVFDSRTSP